MARAPFELSLLGGATERAWRRARPDVAKLAWHTLDADALPRALVAPAQRFWTGMAFQEHRTAACTAATLQALIAARAPVDLVAHAAGFVGDELAHVELCARVAQAIGGAAPLVHDPDALVPALTPGLSAFGRACELALRIYCVGEAFSLALQQATARAQRHPLLSAVIGRIARDEAKHAAFGWLFFDWADELVDEPLRAALRRVATEAVEGVAQSIERGGADDGATFGWLPRRRWQTVARRALDDDVVAPLRARDLL
jgi:hypothetical protein